MSFFTLIASTKFPCNVVFCACLMNMAINCGRAEVLNYVTTPSVGMEYTGIFFLKERKHWLKSLTFSLLSILIRECSKTRTTWVLSSPNLSKKVVWNWFQLVIKPSGRKKYHVEAFPLKVYGKIMHTTSSSCTLINWFASKNFWIWSSMDSFEWGLNLGNSFSGCFGRWCFLPGMDKASRNSHGYWLSFWLF